MAVVDDIWEHAQNTRMWLQTAHDASGRATSKSAGSFILSYFTRGSSRRTAAGDIFDAIGKLRLAYLDLEHALHRAGHTPLPLRTLELERTAPELTGSHKRLSSAILGALGQALTADLAAIDSLVTEVEQLQRQARMPQSR
jgi:hypothetical protein